MTDIAHMDPAQKRAKREKIRLKSQRFRDAHPGYTEEYMRQWRKRHTDEYRASNRERGKRRYAEARKTLYAIRKLIGGVKGMSATLDGRKVVIRYVPEMSMTTVEGSLKSPATRRQVVTDTKYLFAQRLHKLSLEL